MQTIIGLLFTHSIADSSNVIPVFLGEKIIKRLYLGMSVTILPEHEYPSPVNPSLQVQL